MKVEELFEFLKKTQESKGYYFNRDKDKVRDLLTGLLENKSTLRLYGLSLSTAVRGPVMGSRHNLPLRLSGTRCQRIRQLLLRPVCQHGSGMQGTILPQYVPERRPPDKIMGPDI